MKIAIVGTRGEITRAVAVSVQRLVFQTDLSDVIVTGCSKGVDALVRKLARGQRTLVICQGQIGPSAGLTRNAVIAQIADVCHAFPAKVSRGTWDCINAFSALGKTVHVYDPETGLVRP